MAVDQSETCGDERPGDQNAIELTTSGGSSHSRNDASNSDLESQVAVERANFAGRGVLLLSPYPWGGFIDAWHYSHPGDYEYYRWRTLGPSSRRGCGDQHHHPHGYFIALNGIPGEMKEANELCPVALSRM